MDVFEIKRPLKEVLVCSLKAGWDGMLLKLSDSMNST